MMKDNYSMNSKSYGRNITVTRWLCDCGASNPEKRNKCCVCGGDK